MFTSGGLFTLPIPILISDNKPNVYNVLCKPFHTAQSPCQIPILISYIAWDRDRYRDKCRVEYVVKMVTLV